MKTAIAGLILISVLAACGSAPAAPTVTVVLQATLVPTNTPFVRRELPPVFTATPTPNVSPTPAPILVEPLTGVRVQPPLTIDLPSEWETAYDTFLYQELGDVITVPFALYQGPVTGGQGTIVLLWNFRSVTAANTLGTPLTTAYDWSDGLRLLRYPIFEPTCNIGTDPQRNFTVGQLPASGTNFRVVDCPELPNTKGWFAGLSVGGIGYVFYVYTDPIEALSDPVPSELQAILDSVRFTSP